MTTIKKISIEIFLINRKGGVPNEKKSEKAYKKKSDITIDGHVSWRKQKR